MVDAQEQIEKFQEFIELNYQKTLQNLISKGKKSLVIDFSDLTKFDHELSDQLLEEPENTIKAAEIAIEQFDLKEPLKVRLKNLPEAQKISIRDIRARDIGKFIFFEGIVRQASDIRPQVVNAKFECPSCGTTISIIQTDKKFKEPTRCSCGRKGHFRLLHKELVDAQRLVIEEAAEDLEGGAQPKRLSIFLKEDLVEPKMEKKTTPGTKVRATGIITEVARPLTTGGTSTIYDLVMNANNIESIQEDFSDIEINQEDEEEIKKLAKDIRIFEKLTKSIAPSIMGHERIKEALLLQLIGGVRKQKEDGTIVRGDMHVLLVGDPGAGKSAMLTFIAKAAPKARYIAGKGTSSAGLTASVVKDEFLKGWALEAGAMVLANKGIVVLDEMDKMTEEDTSALHEGMEQQVISIAKANIQACYSEDTEVLTNKGWKKYYEVNKDDEIAQLDNGLIQFVKPKGLAVYDYDGIMYNFIGKGTDVLVTPNHRMYTKKRTQKKYEVIEAQNLNYSSYNFLNNGNYISKNNCDVFILPKIKFNQKRKHTKYINQLTNTQIPINLWLEFLGYYLSEGGISKLNYTIRFGQEKYNKKFKNCLEKISKIIGQKLTENKYENYSIFQITSKQLWIYLKTNCGEKDSKKYIPPDIFKLQKHRLKVLYNALMLGDGDKYGKGYSTISKRLADDFQVLAFLIGKSANLRVVNDKRLNRKKLYRICLCNRNSVLLSQRNIKKIGYKDKVFCFSVPSGVFVTRRNGKIAIQGNTLTCRTTVLAAANPKFGRFDPYKPVAEQIDLPPALINRFDLIFPIRDLPDKVKDSKIAQHILEQHQEPKSVKPEIAVETLRKYIAYVKQKISPVLTEQAMQEIKKFYVSLRNSESVAAEGVRPIPITPRQLEALIRLAEGSARIRLSKKITKSDAKRAIVLLKYCLTQVGIDPETGQIDIDVMQTGISSSKRNKISIILQIIDTAAKKGQKTIPIEELIAEAEEKRIEEREANEVIEKLKREGEIFEPKNGFIQKV